MANPTFNPTTLSGSDYDWSNPSNWTGASPPGGVPQNNDNVTLPADPSVGNYTSLDDINSLSLSDLDISSSTVTLDIASR
jgi:hypothetical protein